MFFLSSDLHLTHAPQFPASSSRSLATATNAPDGATPKRRFAKLEDGLTFDDFVSGEPLPEAPERVVLGNTSQCVFTLLVATFWLAVR